MYDSQFPAYCLINSVKLVSLIPMFSRLGNSRLVAIISLSCNYKAGVMNPFAFCIRLNNSQWVYKQEMVKLRSELRFELTQCQWQGCLDYVCVCVCVCLCDEKEWTKKRLPFPSHLWKSISGELEQTVSSGLGQNLYLQSAN